MEIQRPSSQPIQIIWGIKDGLVRSVNDWVYQINRNGLNLEVAGEHRKSKTKEWYNVNSEKLIYSNSREGKTERTYYMFSPNRRKLLPRKIEVEEAGVVKNMRSIYYDDQARVLLDKDNEDLRVNKYVYNDNGDYTKEVFHDGKLLRTMKYKGGRCELIRFGENLSLKQK